MSLRDKLIIIRDQNHLSQQEFADRIGVSRQTVSRWESGKSTPSAAQIAKICAVFHLDANSLLNGGAAEGSPAEADQEGSPQRVQASAEERADSARKSRRLLLIVIGALLLVAVAGLVTTIVYAVKDAMYDAGATVWIISLPQNTPMIVLSVFLAIFIALLAALLIYLLRRKIK